MNNKEWSFGEMVLRAVVILPGSAKDLGDLLAISRAQAKKRERTENDIPILALKYIEELKVYVAIYEVPTTNAIDANFQEPLRDRRFP